MAIPAAVLSVLVNAHTGGAAANLTRLDKRLRGTAAQSEAMSARVSKAAKLAGLGIAAGVGGSVYAAAKFESAFAEVRKTVDANAKGYKQLEGGLLGLSKQIPESANALAQLAGEAGALGVKRREIVKFTKTAAMLGTTTNLSSEDAAASLARLGNIMESKGRKAFQRMGSTLVDLGNKGASTEDEIASMALRIAGAGRTLGLTEAEVLGLSASLANVGIRSEMGGSAISRVMLQMQEDIAKGGEGLDRFAEISGVSVDRFVRTFEADAPRAIAMFADGLGKVNERGEPLISTLKDVELGERRVGDTLLRIAGNTKQFTGAQEVANEAWADNTALSKEAAQRYGTLESQLDLLKNTVIAGGIAFGKKMLPDLKEFVSVMRDPKLDFDEKVDHAVALASKALENGIEEMAEGVGEHAPTVASAFIRGFSNANVWGKLAIGALLLSKFGGKGGLFAAGASIGRFFGMGAAAGAASSVAGKGASAGLAGGLASALGKVKWGRVGAVGIGLALADEVLNAYTQHLKKGSDDALEALEGIIGTETSVEIAGFNLVDDESVSAAENLKAQLEEVAEKRTAISATTEESLKLQLEELGVNEAAREQIEMMFDVLRRGRDLGTKVDLGTDPAQLTKLRNAFEVLRTGALNSLKDIGTVTRENTAIIKAQFGGTEDAPRKLAESYRASAEAIRLAMERGEIDTDSGLKRIRTLLRNAKLVSGEDPFKIAEGFATGWEKAGGINDRQRQKMIADLGKMPPQAREKAYDAMVKYGQGLVNGGKIPQKDLRDFKSEALTKFDDLRESAKTKGEQLFEAYGGSFKKLDAAITASLGSIGSKVSSMLKAFGGAPRFDYKSALKMLPPLPQGKQDGGYIVPGTGSGDKFMTMGEVGAFVLNRKATRGAGLQKGGAVPLALEPGERYFTPREVDRIGRPRLERLNSEIPRFQTGGTIGKPQITGPSGALRDLGQGAVDQVHGAASAYLGKQRRKTSRPAGPGKLSSAPGSLVQALGPYSIPPFQYDANHAGGNSHWHIHMATQAAVIGVGKQLQQMGFMVGEHPAFGGIQGSHSPTGGHPVGLAIDVNSAADETRAETVRVARLLGGFQKGGLIQALAKGGDAKGLAHHFQRALGGIWPKAARHYKRRSDDPMPWTFVAGDKTMDGASGFASPSKRAPYGKTTTLSRRAALGVVGVGEPSGRGTLLHEWAHVFQKGGLKKWESEGGAEAFKMMAGPEIFPGDAVAAGFGSRTLAYERYKQKVLKRKSDQWIKRGQFKRAGGLVQALADGGWVKTGYTTYDIDGPGAYGNLMSGAGYAELGTATQGGTGTGTGYIARALGKSGELPKDYPLDVKIGDTIGTLFKRDRGYGQGDPFYSIDIHRLGFDEVGLTGNNKGTAFIRPAGGKGGGDAPDGPTEGERKRAEGKRRKANYESKLKQLRQRVADSKTAPAKQSALWKLMHFWGRAGIFDKEERGHILGAVQQASAQMDTEGAVKILSHLGKYALNHGEITGQDPDNFRSLTAAIEKARERGQEKRKKAVKRNQRGRARRATRIAARGNFPKLAQILEAAEGTYEGANQAAERLVALEPEDITDAYVGMERGAWSGVLGSLASWRNKVVNARDFATSKIPRWEEQINNIKALRYGQPNAWKKHRWKIGPLREAIGNARSFTEERQGDMTDLQGIGGPTGPLGSLAEDSGYWLTLGGPGARIFDTQNMIRELALKVQTDPSPERDTEREALLEQLTREANQRAFASEALRNVLPGWDALRQGIMANFAGGFATGGWIGAGKWGVVGERGPEIAHGPVGITPISQAPPTTSGGGDVRVIFNGEVSIKQGKGDRRPAIEVRDSDGNLLEQVRAMPGTGRRHPGSLATRP